MFKGILLLPTVFGPGLMFTSTESNKINLKNESYSAQPNICSSEVEKLAS